jgi:hypothetical protein
MSADFVWGEDVIRKQTPSEKLRERIRYWLGKMPPVDYSINEAMDHLGPVPEGCIIAQSPYHTDVTGAYYIPARFWQVLQSGPNVYRGNKAYIAKVNVKGEIYLASGDTKQEALEKGWEALRPILLRVSDDELWQEEVWTISTAHQRG